MKNVFLLLMLIWCTLGHADMVANGESFCRALKQHAPKKNDGRSLFHVKKALGIKGRVAQFAKDSTVGFERLGFTNLLAQNSNLLSNPDLIPNGAIFILDASRAPNCPVNKKYGHVAVKCGSDSLYWGQGHSKQLSSFVQSRTLSNCIKSVMYNEIWDKQSKTEAVDQGTTPPSEGAQ